MLWQIETGVDCVVYINVKQINLYIIHSILILGNKFKYNLK